MGLNLSVIKDNTVLPLAGAIFIILLWRGLKSYEHLRAFQGPFLAATSIFWILKGVFHKNLHLELKRACDKYG